MREPWLRLVLDGHKTVESRFSKRPVAPHGAVRAGDLVLFKRPAGPLCGASEITAVEFHQLEGGTTDELQGHHGAGLCADKTFWLERSEARYVTLMTLTHVREISEVYIDKRDRRGWVVLEEGPHIHTDQLQLAGLAETGTPASRALVQELASRTTHPKQLALSGWAFTP